MRKWFYAIYLFSSHKKGISSKQLGKDINFTQKTACFILSRIRHTFANNVEFEFDDITQLDETYIGRKNKNRNKKKKVDNTQGRSLKTKIPVFGMLSNGLVYAEVVKNTKGRTLLPIIQKKIKFGSTNITDGWVGYKSLYSDYKHFVIKHNQGVFKMGSHHTNGIEGFWSQFKRGLIGIYHYVTPKTLTYILR